MLIYTHVLFPIRGEHPLSLKIVSVYFKIAHCGLSKICMIIIVTITISIIVNHLTLVPYLGSSAFVYRHVSVTETAPDCIFMKHLDLSDNTRYSGLVKSSFTH